MLKFEVNEWVKIVLRNSARGFGSLIEAKGQSCGR